MSTWKRLKHGQQTWVGVMNKKLDYIRVIEIITCLHIMAGIWRHW
jgi:hypothetical protein